MTKVYCGRYSCRFCLGEVCTKDIISVKDDGRCNSYRGEMGNVWSSDPWDNYEKQGVKENTDDIKRVSRSKTC